MSKRGHPGSGGLADIQGGAVTGSKAGGPAWPLSRALSLRCYGLCLLCWERTTLGARMSILIWGKLFCLVKHLSFNLGSSNRSRKNPRALALTFPFHKLVQVTRERSWASQLSHQGTFWP